VNSAGFIDLRSDTVTEPSTGMRAAMMAAPVGDDVYGEDPTVNELQAVLAEMAGMEQGLFMPSGTQSNLVALISHCARGDEYIVGQQAHTYKYEGGGAAVLGGIQPQPLELNAQGGLDLDLVQAAIKPLDDHFAKSRLLCLENTMQGKVLPMPYLSDAVQFAKRHSLGLHLDGARAFNAAVASDVSIAQLVAGFDSVSICLSKGLGAPVGSVLLGSKDFIETARRWRKITGGGLRQAGILAAAGLYALSHNIDRLAHDHRRAKLLASSLRELGLEVEPVQTNMVFVQSGEHDPKRLCKELFGRGIKVSAATRLRLVTHLDIDDADIAKIVAVFRRLIG
jgi:threonine aldolase